MSYAVRPMRLSDVLQVTEIDRQAFPTFWPPTSFKEELAHNKLARYLVAWKREDPQENPNSLPLPFALEKDKSQADTTSRLWRWTDGVRHLFSRGESLSPPEKPQPYIVGYSGTWFVLEEAHLTSIAVRPAYQRLGIGELILLSSIELAIAQKAQSLTLEVRVSNHGAQALYTKHGFLHTGLRKGYYSDNNEDALIMTTERLLSPEYQALFRRLKQAHAEKWGESEIILP